MSISSWKEEFYIPVWNVPEGDESAAIAQSLQKFRGLRQEVLAKHGLTRIGSEGRMYPKIGELGGSWFDIDATSCALCDQYYLTFPGDDHGCADCPLYKELGNMTCYEDDAPYNVWYLRNDPEPMIEVLEKMLKDRE